jgi:iron complex outermembrane recepter protein
VRMVGKTDIHCFGRPLVDKVTVKRAIIGGGMKTAYATLRSGFLGASVGLLVQTGAMAASATDASAGDVSVAQTGTVPSAENSGDLSEIIVTANKRSESVQKAPAAITALNADALAELGVRSAVDLTKIVPGAEIVEAPGVAQGFIRGVGSNIDDPYVDPGVAINVNGISTPRYASSAGFLDVARVEVLPGPQGTLYGGSAAGGVINIISVLPGHNYAGEGTIEAGNYGMAHAFIAQNIPVGEDLSLRAAVDFERHDGYQSRDIDSDRAKTSGRLSALWIPTDDFTAYVFGSFFDDAGKPGATVNSPLLNPRDPWSLPTSGPVVGNPVDADFVNGSYKNYIVGGRFDYNFGGATLSYIPGAVIIDVQSDTYAAYFPFALTDKEHQYSNELRLSNDVSDRNSWVLGLYQSIDHADFSFYFAGAPSLLVPAQTNKDYAGYAQDVFRATDWLRVTFGGRFSYDSKDATDGTGAAGLFSADHSWTHADYKIGVDADLATNALGYATVQTGYLPGGYTPLPNSPTFNNNVEPEKLLSYTIGVKSRFLNDKLTLNDEAYYYTYKNYQVVAISLETGYQTVYNAPRSLIYGDQVNAVYKLTDADTINLGVNFMSAHFTELNVGGVDLAGYQLANAPVMAGTGGYEHRSDLPDGSNISFRVQSHVQSGYWGVYDHPAGARQDAYTKTDLTLTYTRPNKGWSVGLWVKNVENTAVFQAAAAGGQPGPASSFIAPPRTFGVTLSDHW